MIDIVNIFEGYATTAEYEFAYGRKDIQNWEITENKSLDSGESILLVFPFVENADIANSIIHSWSASTQLWLGRKFDTSSLTGTFSQLDETERQKYDRRLKALREDIETYIKAVFCGEPGLELTSARIVREINQFDENLDFIVAEIAFTYDSRV